MVTGKWPDKYIDHIDGDGNNNSWGNIRSVDALGNNRNLAKRIGRDLPTGVRWHKKRQKWEARIRVKGRLIYLGLHDDVEDAMHAREIANQEYGFHPNHGKRIRYA